MRARLLIIEISPGDINWSQLTKCQKDAASGVYARIMAAFIQWVACSGLEARRQFHKETSEELREELQESSDHRRTADIIANLKSAHFLFTLFLNEHGLIDDSEMEEMHKKDWAAFDQIGLDQNQNLMTTDPVDRFLTLLGVILLIGRAHVKNRNDNNVPENSEIWGWQRSPRGDTNPKGERVGWLDHEGLYLDPEASYAAVQQYARLSGEPLPISSHTLRRRLYEKGFLLTVDESRGRFLVRKPIGGKRVAVLHLHKNSLLERNQNWEMAADVTGKNPSLLKLFKKEGNEVEPERKNASK